jgi:hypothetical protein
MDSILTDKAELIVEGQFTYSKINLNYQFDTNIYTNSLLSIWNNSIPGVTTIKFIFIEYGLIRPGEVCKVRIIIWHPFPIRKELQNAQKLFVGPSRTYCLGEFVCDRIVGYLHEVK